MHIIIRKGLWAIFSALLISSSLYFIFKLNFLPFRINKIKRKMVSKKKSSMMSALFLSLGGRIGVGSIAGVALAIYIGGPGSIFWLFVFSFLSSILAFCEVVLANKYKIKNSDGYYYGGPSYYLKYGLNKKIIGMLYAIILLFSYVFGFTGIQANTITLSIGNYFNISKYLIALILSIITFLIIIGGTRKVMKFSSIIVPFMSLLYIISSLIIILININKLPSSIALIIQSAFNIKPFFSSFIPMIIIGIQRGIFSSEAGIGTCAVSSCATDDTNLVRQGLIQMFGIYISIFICIVTALVILLCGNFDSLNGISVINNIFHKSFGVIGDLIILISIILFSFSTILTGFYYGESSLKFLDNSSKNSWLKVFTIVSVFIGSIMREDKIWNLVDTLISILAIINLTALLLLRKEIFNELDYDK